MVVKPFSKTLQIKAFTPSLSLSLCFSPQNSSIRFVIKFKLQQQWVSICLFAAALSHTSRATSPPPPKSPPSTSPPPPPAKTMAYRPQPSNCSHGAEAPPANSAAASKKSDSTQLRWPTSPFPPPPSLSHQPQAKFKYSVPQTKTVMVFWRWVFLVGYSTRHSWWMARFGFGVKAMGVDSVLGMRILRFCPHWIPIWIRYGAFRLVGCILFRSPLLARSILGQYNSKDFIFIAFLLVKAHTFGAFHQLDSLICF